MSLTATRALYIKLGVKNCWVGPAFQTSTLRIGYSEISHEMAVAAAEANDFTPIKTVYKKAGHARGTAKRYSNEVREFYTAGSDVLWITFDKGRL